MTVDLKANEVVLKASDSKQLIDEKKIKGKLIITNQRIYFKTSEKNDTHHDMEIIPGNIKEVIYFNFMKIFPTGLNLIMRDGISSKFLIGKRNDFGLMINKMY